MRTAAYILSSVLVMSSACADKPSGSNPDVGLDEEDVRTATADLGEVSDSSEPTVCVALFGNPSERTGLSSEQCASACSCPASVRSASFDDSATANLLAWRLETPLDELTEDPYQGPHELTEGNVCVATFEASAGTYALETRTRGDEGGGVVTHSGACGRCSTLQDLEAYVRNGDLTEPVRQCGLDGIRDGEEANIACLEALGFTGPCAQIWYYNTSNTRMACLEPCFAALNDPYHLPDGSLNECLACDERESGVTFKSVAGRTRRNSGLASAICRPCVSVTEVTHDYPRR